MQLAPDQIEHAKAEQEQEFQSHLRQLDSLLVNVQAISDPTVRDTTAQILQTMMELHGAGIGKIFARIADAGELGQSIIKDLAEDDLVSSILLLYGLHPLDLETRVRSAVQKMRPLLGANNVEFLRVSDDAAVHLKLQTSGHMCGSTAKTLKHTIEQAIYDLAPEVTAIHVAGLEEPAAPAAAGFVSVEQLIATTSKHSLRGTNHVGT